MKNKINNGITWLGKRFEFDSHYFVKNSLWLLMGQGIMSFSALIATVFLANFVSQQNLGDYRMIIAIYGTLAFFALPGIGVALMRSIANGNDGAMNDAIKIKTKFTLVAILVGAITAFYFGIYRENTYFGLSVLIATLCLPFIETFSLYASFLQGKHDFKHSSFNAGLVKLFSTISVIFASYFYPTVVVLVGAFYISQAAVTFLQYKILLKKFPPQNDKKDEEMLPYAKHITYAGIFGMLFGQADKFILYHFFGPIALAKFWIASTIPQEIGRVLGTVVQVSFPKFAKVGDYNITKKRLFKRFWLLTISLILLSLVYSLIAYPFFSLFFPQYIDGVSKSIVLMFAFAVTPSMLIWQYYTAKRNIKVIYINNMVDPVLQVILYIILIPLFGIWGLVYSIFIKTVIMNLLALYILKVQ